MGYVLSAASLWSLSACSANAEKSPPRTRVEPTAWKADAGEPSAPASSAAELTPTQALETELVVRTSLSPSATVRANELSLRMLRELSAKQTNVVVSPLAAMLALHMAWQGARGATAQELASALSLEPDQAAALSLEIASLRTGSGASDALRMNTGLYTAAQLAIVPAFNKLAQENYRANMAALAFAEAPDAARAHINRDIATETGKQLRELLAPGQVDSTTRAVLTSALALSPHWSTAFDPRQTRERPFTRSDHSVAKVPVMVREGEFALGMLGEDTTVVELPYVGERLVMDFVVPSPDQPLPPEAFDVDALGRTLERLAPARVRVQLPRFEAALTSVALKPFFQRLGVRTLFKPGEADLSGVAGSAGELHVAEVFHGTWVKVDERGAKPPERQPSGGHANTPTVAVDRPFLFFVRDRVSDLILCAGRIDDPSRKR